MMRLLDWAFGPTFAKEAIEIARRRRYYAARAGVALAMLAAVGLAAWRLGDTVTIANREALTAKQAEVAGVLAGNIGAMLFLSIALLTPMFLCGAVSGERQNGTLELLFTTHLTDREIVLGKFLSRIAVLVKMVLAALPVFALLTLIGGVAPAAILTALVASLFAALVAGGLALYFTTVCRTPFRALAFTYLTGLALALLLAPFLALLLRAAVDPPKDDAGWMAFAVGLPMALGVAALLCGAFALAAVKNLRNAPAAPVRQEREDRGPSAPMDTGDDSGGLAGKAALWGPVRIAVDRDEPSLLHNWWVFVVLVAAFAFCVYMFAVVNPYQSGRVGGWLLPVWVGVLAVATVLAVTNPLFSRRPGFFDDLLTTTLDSREILQGTLFVSWPVAVRLLAVPWTLGMIWVAANPVGLLAANVLGTLFMLTLFAVGNAASLVDYRLLQRLAAPFGFLALTWFGTWLLAGETYRLPSWAPLLAAAAALAGAQLWQRRAVSAWSAGTLIATGHWFAVAAAVAAMPFVVPASADLAPSPLLRANPIHWLYQLLVEVPDNVRWNPAWIGGFLYIAALALHLTWAYRWLARNFDRLTGRTQARPG